MEKWNGTKGVWRLMPKGFDGKENENLIQVYSGNEDLEFICQVWNDRVLHQRTQDFKANAELIADAGNTIQKCDLLPSELLEQRDELLESLKELVEASSGFNGAKNAHPKSPLFKANELINKI